MGGATTSMPSFLPGEVIVYYYVAGWFTFVNAGKLLSFSVLLVSEPTISESAIVSAKG